jgi:hypothetical protein
MTAAYLEFRIGSLGFRMGGMECILEEGTARSYHSVSSSINFSISFGLRGI